MNAHDSMSNPSSSKRHWLSRFGLLIALMVITILLAIVKPSFLTVQNLLTLRGFGRV